MKDRKQTRMVTALQFRNLPQEGTEREREHRRVDKAASGRSFGSNGA